MADIQTMSNDATAPRTKATAKYIRWGGLAAILGPLLVLAANVYQLWVTWTYSGGPLGPSLEALIEIAPTATHIAFGAYGSSAERCSCSGSSPSMRTRRRPPADWDWSDLSSA